MITFQPFLPSWHLVDRVPTSSAVQHFPCFYINKFEQKYVLIVWFNKCSFGQHFALFSKLQVTKVVVLPISLLQVQMKDFRFSYKFKMACKEDVLKLCPNIKKKYVVPDQAATWLYKYVIKWQGISW